MKPESFRLRPTALWIIFGPILGCMWLAAVNYSNNLIYAILYLIASLVFISIFHTWKNLASLSVEHIRIHPAFAGDDVRVEIFLRNPSKQTIYGLYFSRLTEEANHMRQTIPLRRFDGRSVRLEAGDTFTAEVHFPSDRRGLYRFDTLQIRTSYPFGLVWARIRIPVNADYFIYPQAKGSVTWPAPHSTADSGTPSSRQPGDDFAGVRVYAPGESLRHVDWKAFARGRPLSIKQFTGGSGQELRLDAAELGKMTLEARLSQLALWVIAAEKAGIPYALQLGRTSLPVGLGETQARRALEALALAGAGTA